MSYQAITIRADVDALLAARAEAMEKFEQSMALLQEASQSLMSVGFGESVVCKSVQDTGFYGEMDHSTSNTAKANLREHLDRALWVHLGNVTGLHQIMDKTARDEWHENISKNPPVCNLETLEATFNNLHEQRAKIFNRGLVKAFQKLSSNYKTNDAFKIGKKIVMSNAIGYYGHGEEYLSDVERVLYVLDGRKPPERNDSVAHALSAAGGRSWAPSQGTFKTDYMDGKTFKNGNAHVTFTRPDLIEKANKIIAAFYSETLPNDSHRTT